MQGIFSVHDADSLSANWDSLNNSYLRFIDYRVGAFLLSTFWGTIYIESIIIPDSITRIKGYTFSCCASLKSITIPDSVTDIGNSAFYLCTGLTSITIPSSVKSIANYAFADCKNLRAVYILNPACELYDSEIIYNEYDSWMEKKYFYGTIYGCDNSTAQSYAEKYNVNFVSLGVDSTVQDDVVATAEENDSQIQTDIYLNEVHEQLEEKINELNYTYALEGNIKNISYSISWVIEIFFTFFRLSSN